MKLSGQRRVGNAHTTGHGIAGTAQVGGRMPYRLGAGVRMETVGTACCCASNTTNPSTQAHADTWTGAHVDTWTGANGRKR